MAVTSGTNYRKQEQIARQNGGQQYTGLRGVSTNTAQKLGNYQTGYQPGQQAQAAQKTLQQVQAQKPQSYNSKYGAQLDSIMNQIANPEKFKYEFNGDELFKYYADLYTQKGRQASMDAMGQAAALTGGYGNSYAQQVGQQGYEQYLLNLYDRGMDLQNAAYARYQDAQRLPYQQLEALQGMDESEYGRYRDTVGDWERELGRAEDAARYEREFDYNDWQKQQDYYTKLAQIENADYQTEQDRQEAIRQFQLNYDRDVLESDRAYNRDVLENDRAFQEQVRQADLDEQYRRDTLAEQIRQDQRDYERAVLENDRNYNRDVLESDRAFQEALRQANLDEQYRRDTLAEQIRQADIDNQYRTDYFNWQQGTDQRDFDETKRLNDQKVAANYAMAILENGQMPSLEMLMAAGLSEEDARKLMAQAQQIVYGGPGPAVQEEEQQEEEKPKLDAKNVTTPRPTWTQTKLNNFTLTASKVKDIQKLVQDSLNKAKNKG
jgi:hypothetical protein